MYNKEGISEKFNSYETHHYMCIYIYIYIYIYIVIRILGAMCAVSATTIAWLGRV